MNTIATGPHRTPSIGTFGSRITRLVPVISPGVFLLILAAVWASNANPPSASAAYRSGDGSGQTKLEANIPACDPNWVLVTSSNAGSVTNALQGVSAVSANDVWAVGSYSSGSADRTLIERWNGTGWNAVSSPEVGIGDNILNAVAVVSVNDVWAVGTYQTGSTEQTLIERWNGSTWNVVVSPNASANDNFLYAVSALAANDVWAVGYYLEGAVGRTLTMHWNGAVWSIVSSPNVSSTYTGLQGVTAISANDVWAVGYYEYTPGVVRTFTEHWNGIEWSVIASPNVGTIGNILMGVTAVSANDAWAVGFYSNGDSIGRTLILRWDGSIWNAVTSPNVNTSTNLLRGVTAISPNDVWAVGQYVAGPEYLTLILRWNGSTWNVVASPNVSSDQSLLAVTAVSANDVWAVGTYDAGSTSSTLVERYNPCVASPTPTLTPPPTQTPGGPTATPIACTIEFTDVLPGSTFYDFVMCMACQGIINGYTSGCETGNPCFRPNSNVTRGQLTKIVANAAGFSEPVGAQQYEDVPPGSTFFDFVWRLSDRGIVSGYTCGGQGEPCVPPANLPYFRPNGNATRGQISKIVANAANLSDPPGNQLFEDVAPGSTFYDFVQRLANLQVMSGYACGGAGEPCNPPGNLPYFRPANNATRGQTSKIVANTFFPNCSTMMR
jgi:hypothetical protein